MRSTNLFELVTRIEDDGREEEVEEEGVLECLKRLGSD